MTEAELLGLMPLPEYIPLTTAVEILGGGHLREQELRRLIAKGHLPCPSHAPTPGSTRTNHRLGIVEDVPVLTPDTDPETVLLDSEDIIWRWCVAVEDALHPTPDGLPPKELVDSRFRDLKRRFAERMLGMTPEAHQTGGSEPKLEEQESVTESASTAPGPGKKWTPERLAELKAYRATHGTKAAAAHYKISPQRVRQLWPSDKLAPKGYSVFTHRQR